MNKQECYLQPLLRWRMLWVCEWLRKVWKLRSKWIYCARCTATKCRVFIFRLRCQPLTDNKCSGNYFYARETLRSAIKLIKRTASAWAGAPSGTLPVARRHTRRGMGIQAVVHCQLIIPCATASLSSDCRTGSA